MDTTVILSDKAKKLGPPKGKKLRKLKYNGARRDAGKHEEAAKACSVPALDAMERSVPTLDAMERGSTASPGSQSATSAFGTRYVSDSIVDKTLSWLAFFVVVMPIGGFLIITGVVSGPRHFQKFALWCLTGPFRSSLLGVLLARIPSIVYDFFWNALEFLGTFEQRMWTDSLNPDRRAYLDGSFGRNLVLWDTMRIGDYDLAREIALDPKRKRAACLDGWLIKGAQLPYATNLPLFFNTGSEYHSAWRTAFKRHITAPESVVAKLANGGEGAREKLRLRLEAWLGPGWGSIKPPNFPGSKWLVQPVFETLMGILFDTEELPEDLIEKVAVYTTAGAMYWLLAPSYPPLFQTAGTLAPLRLKEYLYLNHNAAKPDQLRGRAVDWRAMADEVPGVETVTANANGERPPDGSEPPVFCDCMGGCCVRCMLDTGEKNATNQGPSRAEEKVDRLLDSVCVAMLLAATAGTTTATGNVLKKFLHFPQSFYFPQFGFNIFGFGLALNQHDWQVYRPLLPLSPLQLDARRLVAVARCGGDGGSVSCQPNRLCPGDATTRVSCRRLAQGAGQADGLPLHEGHGHAAREYGPGRQLRIRAPRPEGMGRRLARLSAGARAARPLPGLERPVRRLGAASVPG